MSARGGSVRLPLLRSAGLLASMLRLIAVIPYTAGPAAAGAAQVDWRKATPVTVATVEYRFEPNRLVLRRGTRYRLRVVNRGHELHELTAPKFYRASELRDTRALSPEHTEIVVQPGEHKDLYFVARRRGHFKFWCADHDWAGMTGEISVN
jgi:uncharacterized cupredoxin-like copper-binding protein